MNSNRMKYASTPTYGMQKRNFSKKQAATQAVPTPDFTQQPSMDPNTPVAPFPAQNTFGLPQNMYAGAAQQPTEPFYINPQNSAPQMAPGMSQPMYGLNSAPYGVNQPVNGYNTFMPQQQDSVPLYQQPLGAGQPPQMGGSGFMPGAQGFTPPGYMQGSGATPPSVTRSEPMAGFGGTANMSGGMNAMGGMGMPNGLNMPNGMGGAYGNAGFPTGSPSPAFGTNPYPPNMMNSGMGGNGFGRPPFGGMDGGSPAMPTPRPPFDFDKWLKIFLFAILPMLFIPCLFVPHAYDFLRYLFIILSVVGLSIIWYRQAFTPAARMTVTIAYLVMSIVVIAMLISGNKDVTQTAGNLANQNAGEVTVEPTASAQAAPLAAQETPSPGEDLGESEAEQRLATFMDYWQVNRIEDMVNLVQPSWATTQDNPASMLFTVISNRTPQEYTIESISGTAADSSRTVTMSAFIDKNNGKDAVRYRFMILMVKEGGEWYVDPNSLATNDTVTATPSTEGGKATVLQSLAPRMTVTPIPDPSTKLYYNANGGKYYHIDPNCSAVNPKFLPMASFLYSELDDDPYSSLEPCLKCGAPTQSLGSLAAATSTPTVVP